MLLQTLLYYIGGHWVPVHALGLIMSYFATYKVWSLPESPKYFYVNHKYDSARLQIRAIANQNQLELTDEDIKALVFDTEERMRVTTDEEGTQDETSHSSGGLSSQMHQTEQKLRLLRRERLHVV